MLINGYCIINYCWLLYVILQLLVIIVLYITSVNLVHNAPR